MSLAEKQTACSMVVRLYKSGQTLKEACKAAGLTEYKFKTFIKLFEALNTRYETYRNKVDKKENSNQRRVFTPQVKKEIISQIIEAYPLSGKPLVLLTADYHINERKFYEWLDLVDMRKQWQLAIVMAKHNDKMVPVDIADHDPYKISTDTRLRIMAALQMWTDSFIQAVLEVDVNVDEAIRYFTKKRALEAAGVNANLFYKAYTHDQGVRDMWDKAAEERAIVIGLAKSELMDQVRMNALRSLELLTRTRTVTEKKKGLKIKPFVIKTWNKDKDIYETTIEYHEENTSSTTEKEVLGDFQAVKLALEMSGDYKPRQDHNVQVQGDIVLGIMNRDDKQVLETGMDTELTALQEKKQRLAEQRKGAGSSIFTDYEDVVEDPAPKEADGEEEEDGEGENDQQEEDDEDWNEGDEL